MEELIYLFGSIRQAFFISLKVDQIIREHSMDIFILYIFQHLLIIPNRLPLILQLPPDNTGIVSQQPHCHPIQIIILHESALKFGQIFLHANPVLLICQQQGIIVEYFPASIRPIEQETPFFNNTVNGLIIGSQHIGKVSLFCFLSQLGSGEQVVEDRNRWLILCSFEVALGEKQLRGRTGLHFLQQRNTFLIICRCVQIISIQAFKPGPCFRCLFEQDLSYIIKLLQLQACNRPTLLIVEIIGEFTHEILPNFKDIFGLLFLYRLLQSFHLVLMSNIH